MFGASEALGSTENFGFMGSLVRGLSVAAAQQQKQAKQRNPPYLVRDFKDYTVHKTFKVRRGGGIRVKPDTIERPNVLSAFKPLAKTMSVGGLMNQFSSANTRLVGLERYNKSTFDLQSQECDEDMLFARLIVSRLKKLPIKDKRSVRLSLREENTACCFRSVLRYSTFLTPKKKKLE